LAALRGSARRVVMREGVSEAMESQRKVSLGRANMTRDMLGVEEEETEE
jgi:hypothetical protein